MPRVKPPSSSLDRKQLLQSYEIQLMIRDLVANQCINLADILEDTGVPARELENPSLRLTLDQELSLYIRIAHLNKDPLLAHRTGSKLGLTNYGMLGYAMMASSTVREALQLMVDFAPIVSWAGHSVLTSEVFEETTYLCLTIHPTPADKLTSELEVESTLSSLQTIFNELVGERVFFSAVSYRHRCRMADSKRYQTFFNCPVRFSAERNAVYFSKNLFARRLPHSQPEHASLFKDLCAESLVTLRQDRGLIAAVKAYIEGYGEGMPSLGEAAEYFHQSSRTLRRHLQRQGASFRGLLDEARYSSAKRYLSSTQLTVGTIGKTLGYADVRSFRAAFKRWAGVAPAVYRAKSSVSSRVAKV